MRPTQGFSRKGSSSRRRDWSRVWRDLESHGRATSVGREGEEVVDQISRREARVRRKMCRQSLSTPLALLIRQKSPVDLTTSLPFLYLLFNPHWIVRTCLLPGPTNHLLSIQFTLITCC